MYGCQTSVSGLRWSKVSRRPSLWYELREVQSHIHDRAFDHPRSCGPPPAFLGEYARSNRAEKFLRLPKHWIYPLTTHSSTFFCAHSAQDSLLKFFESFLRWFLAARTSKSNDGFPLVTRVLSYSHGYHSKPICSSHYNFFYRLRKHSRRTLGIIHKLSRWKELCTANSPTASSPSTCSGFGRVTFLLAPYQYGFALYLRFFGFFCRACFSSKVTFFLCHAWSNLRISSSPLFNNTRLNAANYKNAKVSFRLTNVQKVTVLSKDYCFKQCLILAESIRTHSKCASTRRASLDHVTSEALWSRRVRRTVQTATAHTTVKNTTGRCFTILNILFVSLGSYFCVFRFL